MAKAIDIPITGLETDKTWERYKGSRVREYIQGKVGANYRPAERFSDNAYHLLGFETKEVRDKWVEDYLAADDEGKAELLNSDLILDNVSLGGSTDVQDSVTLIAGSSQSSIVSTDGTLKIKLRACSIEFNPIDDSRVDTGESVTLTIEKRASSNDNWSAVTSTTIPTIPAANTDEFTEIDLSTVLGNGSWQLRCIAKGQMTEASSSYIQFGSVIKTNLSLKLATSWWLKSGDPATLSYNIDGQVSKTLHYEISDTSGNIEVSDTPVAIGTTVYTETPRNISVSGLSDGIHNIRAWLVVDGTTTKSDDVNSQIMVVTDESKITSTLVVVNEVVKTISNYVQADIFKFAVFKTGVSSVKLKIAITNYDKSKTYLTVEDNYAINEEVVFNNTLEIEDQNDTIDAYIHIYDEDDNELINAIGFTVDNSENFAPTSNPDFVLNPKSRSNTEDGYNTVINAATDEVVSSTFNNFGFASDGWVNDSNGVKCLRVPSGAELDIDYEPLSDFAVSGNKTASMTMEFDFATRNVVDETAAILKICSYLTSGSPIGFELRPLDACFMTNNLQTRGDQDVAFQDNTRTRIAVNILYNLNGNGVNYIRIFVNGIINREMEYATTDNFLQYVNGTLNSQGIRIGAEGADIDIYSIRIYKRALSATQIRQDYIAALETTDEKKSFRDANDILGDGNLIDYTKVFDKYNSILWTGRIPSYANKEETTDEEAPNTSCTIHIIDDPAHSGTMRNLKAKGQGTSSKGYWKWNVQFKTSYENDNGEEIETDWVDENGTSHGAVYQLADGLPLATKLVWKLNWASSQQSHKIGSVNLFTDLWKRVVGGNSITAYTDENGDKPYAGCRVSTIEKPFMLFTRADENSTPVFYGLVTFGPGKADKPTFGYYKKVLPDMCMIEGSDNGVPLTEHRVPWMLDEVSYNEKEEAYQYNGANQWDFDMGNQDLVEKYFVPAFNFVFLHNTNITYFLGTYEQLIAADNLDKTKQYWVTTASSDGSHAQFDLFRWDYLTNTWVNASANKTDGVYNALNLNTQTGTGTGNNWDSINNLFINWRINDFKENVGNYFNVNDVIYCMQFLKMIGASDNRCKNTYFYIDPVTHLICCMQDDMDTIFLTDNVGRKNKPYYVEEHDTDDNGNAYWNGGDNVLYNLFELAFADSLKEMMNTMFTNMATLGGGSVSACMEKYYFYVQKYFPAVAYNETARLLYEEAEVYYKKGTYTPSTPPLPQSLGDQLQGELEWWKRREVYLSSYAKYGAFSVKDGTVGDASSSAALVFRSIKDTDGNNPNYQFVVTPSIWLYPSFARGITEYDGNTRVKTGEEFTSSLIDSDGNTNVYIRGINYYKSIGVFGNKPVGEAFSLSGEKLVEFDASKPTDIAQQFRPTSIDINAPLIKDINLEGVETLTGSPDYSAETKLETLNLKDTNITSVLLPQTRTLKSVSLPNTITEINVSEVPNLSSFSLQGVDNMSKITVGDNVGSGLDVVTILANCRTAGIQIDELNLTNINWTGVSSNIIEYIADIPTCNITGKIEVEGNLTLAVIAKLTSKFGNIADESNSLYIKYTLYTINSIVLHGRKYLEEVGTTYQMSYEIDPTNGNNLKSIHWTLDNDTYLSIDETTGLITVKQLGNEDANTEVTVTCTMELTDGSTVSASKKVYPFKHMLQLGDIVFADGTYSDATDPDKTAIGVCFYKDDNVRLMMALNTVGSDMWGLYNNASNGVSGIELSDSNYDAYDTPIPNVTSHGLSSGNYITDDTYLQSNGDFVEFGSNVGLGQLGSVVVTQTMYDNYALIMNAAGISVGDRIPYGQYYTILIIAHRNKILQDSNVNLEVPTAKDGKTEATVLSELIAAVIADNDNKNVYRQYYYPIISKCYAYQPTVKKGEVLDDKFKAHHWFCPSIGEEGRIYFYKSHGYDSSTDDANAIFAKAYEAGVLSDLGTSWWWSSSECNSSYSWCLYFSDGNVYYYNYKAYSLVGRPVSAF